MEPRRAAITTLSCTHGLMTDRRGRCPKPGWRDQRLRPSDVGTTGRGVGFRARERIEGVEVQEADIGRWALYADARIGVPSITRIAQQLPELFDIGGRRHHGQDPPVETILPSVILKPA